MRFLINVLDGSGRFEVCEGGSVAVTGTVRLVENPAAERLPAGDLEPDADAAPGSALDTDDIYKELRLRGYRYGGAFRGIRAADARGTRGDLAWDGNWISFMDTMLQFGIIGTDTRELYLPTRLRRALIDPAEQARAAAASPGVLPVLMRRDVDAVRAGGVELRGLKTSLAPRRANAQAPPKLERYTFVPYESVGIDAEDTVRSKTDAVVVSLQLVRENAGVLRLRIAEAALGRAPEALLIPLALRLLDEEPQVRVDATLAAGPDSNLYATLARDLGLQAGFHLIVFANSLKNLKSSSYRCICFLIPSG